MTDVSHSRTLGASRMTGKTSKQRHFVKNVSLLLSLHVREVLPFNFSTKSKCTLTRRSVGKQMSRRRDVGCYPYKKATCLHKNC